MAGLDTAPPRHFPSFGAHSYLGGGFRIPEEPSNKYHARHLIHREHSESSSLLRSYSPEQLIADLQCSQGAAEDLYSSAAVGNCVWNHIYPGETAPPLPVTGICLPGGSSVAQCQDAHQQQEQQQRGVVGSWSTTTFRPSLARGHSLWDHDGTDFSTGYSTQKLISHQASHDTRHSRSTSNSRSSRSEARARPKSAPPRRPAADALCTEPHSSGGAMAAAYEHDTAAAAGAAAAPVDGQDWEYGERYTSTAPSTHTEAPRSLTTTAAVSSLQHLADGEEVGEPMSHSQASGARPKVTRRGDGPFPDNWFSHTPVAVLAEDREAAKQKEALLLSQFHPRPGAKHPSRSKAVHRTVWGSGAGAELLCGDTHLQEGVGGEQAFHQEAPGTAGAAVEGEAGWLEAQMSLQEHDMFGSSRCSSSASSGELSWQHPKEHHSHGTDGEPPALRTISESVSEEQERRSSNNSSEGRAPPQQPAAGATHLGAPGGDDGMRGQSPFQGCPPFQDPPSWPADPRAANQGARGAASGAAAALGGRTPSSWWRSNAKLAALVQQMLQSPAKAQVDPLMPDMEGEGLSQQQPGALQAPLLAPRGSCQSPSSSTAKAAVMSDTAAAAAAMALCGRASPSLTWAKYCSNLQATLGDTRVTPGDAAVTPGVHRAAATEQQHAAWVSELLDRPVKERLRLLEMHSWAAKQGTKATKPGGKAGKMAAAKADGSARH